MLRRAVIGLSVSLMLAAGSSSALAQVGTAFTYQGELKKSGAAVAAPTDMKFSLWTAASGGTQVSSTITQLNVAVTGGLFTTSLDFEAFSYATDQARWLQIEFRNPAGVGSYVPMGTRQRLTPAPYSLATRGLNVDGIGRVGIGTATPTNKLDVVTSRNAYGISHRSDDGMSDVTTYVDGASGWIGTVTNTPFRLFANNEGDSLSIFPGGDVITHGFMVGNASQKVQVFQGQTFLIDSPSQWGGRFSVLPNGNVGFGNASPLTKIDVASGSVIGSSVVTGPNSHDSANRGVKVGFGYQAASGCSPNDFSGMQVAVNPGTNFCGNSMDLLFLTEECNTSCPREVMRINGSGNVGIGTSAPSANFRLDVAGNIRCVTLIQTSAREFKQDIVPLASGLESIMKLKPVSYVWNQSAPEQSRGEHDIGFLADEVNEVLPQIVAKDEHGKPVGIDYGKITPVAVEAIKQLKAENDDLRARLEKIEALLATKATK